MKLGCDRYWLQPSKKLLALHQSVQGEFLFGDFFYSHFFWFAVYQGRRKTPAFRHGDISRQ